MWTKKITCAYRRSHKILPFRKTPRRIGITYYSAYDVISRSHHVPHTCIWCDSARARVNRALGSLLSASARKCQAVRGGGAKDSRKASAVSAECAHLTPRNRVGGRGRGGECPETRNLVRDGRAGVIAYFYALRLSRSSLTRK
jgi:hypothetical protein